MKSLYSPQERRSQFNTPPPPWRRAETFLAEEYNLIEDHSSWHDARAEDGEFVEIKSCVYEYEDGRIGKFKIWEGQLEQLLCRGRVALAVYAPDLPCNIIATELISPSRALSAGTVTELRHSPTTYRRLREIPWPAVISLDEITFGLRHHYVDHYNDPEIEDTLFMYPDQVEATST